MDTKAENAPDVVKDTDLQIRETHWIPRKRNTMKTTPRYITVKMLKTKEKKKILKAAREKHYTALLRGGLMKQMRAEG